VLVTRRKGHKDGRDEPEDQGQAQCLLRHVDSPFLQQEDRGKAGHEKGPGDEGAQHGVEEAMVGGRVEHGFGKAGQFRAARRLVDHESGGGLLPGVGHDDPEGGNGGAHGHHQDGEPVHALRDPVTTEEVQSQEARLQEEGEHALGGQGGAEYVPHEAGIGRPVRPELELHDDPGGHTHGKGKGEHLAEEPAGPHPDLFTRLPALEFDHDEQPGHADGDGGEQVVEPDGHAKLEPGQEDCIHFQHLSEYSTRNLTVLIYHPGFKLTN